MEQQYDATCFGFALMFVVFSYAVFINSLVVFRRDNTREGFWKYIETSDTRDRKSSLLSPIGRNILEQYRHKLPITCGVLFFVVCQLFH
ncbi:hypothetical protein RHODOSMS8_00255 [Rhodobiaceae bacterium]|nr:hypothetical protein RHODOSMS8_00255 [Rhodobiaceae bacterium]